MKHLSMLTKSTLVCGILATAAVMTSCESTSLTPLKAVQRIERSPVTSVYSHNDVNSPRLRDCYEAGPLPERTQRAIISWLHNSTVREFSYVYPQYYLTTTNPKGDGEVVWALCSDGRGNLVGILAPSSKRTPAWDLPTIGGYKLYVCDTPDREALSNAIMESLAEAGYDKVRIDTRKASGIVDKVYLLSKPLNEEEEKQLERDRRERAKAAEALKKKAAAEALSQSSSTQSEDEDDSASADDDENPFDASSSDEDDSSSSDDSDSSDDADDSSDEDDSSSDDEDTDLDD